MTLNEWLHFKNKTEQIWSNQDPNPRVWGYQIQRNTKWLPGYNKEEITEIEKILHTTLPDDISTLLSYTKGLDKPQININVDNRLSNSWHLSLDYLPDNYSKDLKHLEIEGSLDQLKTEFNLQNYHLVPIYSHRYVVTNETGDVYKVFSIWGTDIIVYGDNVWDYLEKEFLNAK
jgi:hypothetical protein